ncbi:MAG: translation elongation factor-like protein [Candidatus Omnitrophica bacterium]|nr:translation elongation factor-like protein [Candidatus Omnitrophota bacterium]
MKEIEIGRISHYFNHISVAAMKIEKGELKKGDSVHIKGHSEDFVQAVGSMQMEHGDIDAAKAGDDIGFKVDRKVHEGDVVYKIVEE